MESFNRSSFMKDLHSKARLRRKLYEEITKDKPKSKKYDYYDFLKNKNPVDSEIVEYNVSYQLSYRGEVGGLFINRQTFKVYGVRGIYTEDIIERNTMDMILDMKGEITNDTLPTQTRLAVRNNLNIDITPRGIERVDKSHSTINNDVYSNIASHGFYVKELDREINISNHKKGMSKVRLDIMHFF